MIVVECASVKKREPTVTVVAVAKVQNVQLQCVLAGCCRLASETLSSSAACDESKCDKELRPMPKG